MYPLIVLLLVIPHVTLAKTIFEPSLGLTNGSFSGPISGSDTITNGTQVKANYLDLYGGFRYGITRRYIHVTAVLEGHMLNLSSAEVDDPSVSVDKKSIFKANAGIGIGYEWNIPLRTYLTVGFPFMGAEVSYFFSEKLLIGFKYSRLTIDFAGAELNVNSYGLALSFPIEFDYPEHWWRKTDWE